MSLLTRVPAFLKSKKSVMVAETPSAVFHYSDCSSDETLTSGKTDAIFTAAKKDLLTLMKLEVGVRAPAPWLHCGGQASDSHRISSFTAPTPFRRRVPGSGASPA